MVNDLNNLEEYCDLCSDFIEALSFMGHELIQLKDNQLYSSTIETLISVLNNSESNSVKIKTLNCLLVFYVFN